MNIFATNTNPVISNHIIKQQSYGIFTYPTLKYDSIDIQSNVFDGANCIPTLYRLLKKCASITRSSS
jgi:hypothetical protein